MNFIDILIDIYIYIGIIPIVGVSFGAFRTFLARILL